MKIVEIVTQQEGAGAQTQAVTMMQELQRRGHHVATVFLFLKRPAFAGTPGIMNIWPRRPRAVEVPFLLGKLWRYLRREQPDIVMTYSHWANVLAAPIARVAGIEHVVANQTGIPSRSPIIAGKLDRLWGSLGIYRFNVCNSRTTELEMRQLAAASYAARLRTIALGVGVKRSDLSQLRLRAKHHLPDVPLLVHVGRLSIEKITVRC